MKMIKQFIKDTYKYLIIYIVLFFIFIIPVPYYINAPGGLININNRIKIDKSYSSKGSFNLSYVSEYDGRLISLLIGIFNRNWDIEKKDTSISKIDYSYIDQLSLNQSINNATYVAYKKANKKINITNTDLYVQYIFKDSKTNLKVGDKIEYVENVKINDIKQLNRIISNYDSNDKINITVNHKGKKIIRTAVIQKIDNKKMIGISILDINYLKMQPKIEYKYDSDESGPSGGLMLSLAIYNSLVKDDITKGKTIVGTGTIDLSGNVGAIDGVKYKIKGVLKKKVDVFFVPKENLKEANQIKKKYHYHMNIVGVSTFDEALDYLKKH